ncbi:hypothetical protein RM844_18165 [Streptomyces sp. DSM 44915]|uniref:Uncharacterized protein n=1 Tax=Streptomyces chisholmiae TaxID=3075540 RepID=A0ABU2JT99_9ACTN|nr:hypothetical protein [Streptomyces sp. DSM 44915]MDT0268212.1 hypothetical protein [Streptomyces sp. DSM 44915]
MTSHNGRDDEPREGVVLPAGTGPVPGEPRPDVTPAPPPPGQPWSQHWGPGQTTPGGPGQPPPTQVVPQVPPAPPGAPPAPPAQPPGWPPAGPDQHAMPTQVTPVVSAGPPAPPAGGQGRPPATETTTQLRAVGPGGRGAPGAPAGPRPLPGQEPRHAQPSQPAQPAQPALPEGRQRPALPGPPGQGAQPTPPGGAADEGATELIPLVTDRFPAQDAATELLRAVPAAGAPDEGATELIPPVTDGPPGEAATQLLPPVPPAGPNPDETTRLRAVPPRQPGRHRSAAPTPPAAGGAAGGPDATQALPRLDGGGGPAQAGGPGGPDVSFNQLFRSAADREPARQPGPSAGWQGGGPGGGGGGWQDGPGPERRRSPALLVGAVIAGCAVLGLLAGYLLSGDGGGSSDDPVQPEAQGEETGGAGESDGAAGEPEQEPDAGEDPEAAARAQAEALSTLLADSNDSRDAVIRSVGNIRECEQLDQAAIDLRAAADQRTGLVDRLNELTLDQLPDSDQLIQALTEAWQASAEADDHYAAWADEARGNRGEVCRGGQAQHTGSANAGDAASGRATAAKERAAELWNPLAGRFGLPERAATQL